MMQEIWVAAVSAAVGALTVPAIYGLRALTRFKKWEPYEPGTCEELPLHPWSFKYGGGSWPSFWCAQCEASLGARRPPYCAERGGHFHFKCHTCGYEWAMTSKAYKEPEPEKTEP
jgi:hypothetical protein